MRVVSLNVGRPRAVPHEGREVLTGIYKDPVSGRRAVRRLNIDGDGQADLRVHGGADKAVYLYPLEHYAYWAAELGVGLFPHGQFGENLTTEGLLEEAVCIGDVFRVGTTLLEVSQPRSPCYKLGIRMGDAGFPARFTASRRIGFYLRVLQEGELAAGNAIERVSRGEGELTVADVFALRHVASGDPERWRRALAVPALADSWRRHFEQRLAVSNRGG
ncbi:molybdenum cofactor biosysynthesis protein [Sulfurifustis variabilis]|uniref:Molybdenum cofactor biosysynthesis protein n=1 Tax=Sulfurifustis variabilis TaxID=1675686 RepID=A0A1B4VCU2_9GAMM|nr:MOSC domain-containing protein [Sulfurifustis variabilis]BAU46857.1 molybdenum cofactor biosysynthesis protein [Sulfurifustis variabilis]